MTKSMKLFLHVLLLGVVSGLAMGAAYEHLRPLICFPLDGAAIALALTFVYHVFLD